jgi:hypothetical protein
MQVEDGEPICTQSGFGIWWPADLEEALNVAEREYNAKGKNLLNTGKALKESAIAHFGAQGRLF